MDLIYDRVKEAIHTKRITVSNAALIVALIMVEVERAQITSGAEKKEMALQIFSRLIEELDADDEESMKVILLLAPTLIDTIVSASKKHFDIQTTACCTLM